ncbi:MAG: group 1 truncated hemoglobin [Magnetovibrio sp.]|nr:group 1 truncated hemoglobin [Magnetovibrio sp.]
MSNEQKTLYERLGGFDGIRKISEDVWTEHTSNPAVKARYLDSDAEEVTRLVTEFVCWGTGGPQEYTGKDMKEAHRTMNINATEFMAVVDDISTALKKNDVGAQETSELLGLLFSLKDEVMHL